MSCHSNPYTCSDVTRTSPTFHIAAILICKFPYFPISVWGDSTWNLWVYVYTHALEHVCFSIIYHLFIFSVKIPKQFSWAHILLDLPNWTHSLLNILFSCDPGFKLGCCHQLTMCASFCVHSSSPTPDHLTCPKKYHFTQCISLEHLSLIYAWFFLLEYFWSLSTRT